VLYVADYGNRVAAVQVIGGSSIIQNNQLSLTLPDDQGRFGYGLTVRDGTHSVESNSFLSDEITGIYMADGATVFYAGNTFAQSPFAVVHCVGTTVQEGENDIHCSMGPEDCVTWNCFGQAEPAPPPALPLDPD